MSLKTVNVVSTFTINTRLNLADLSKKCWNVEYNPRKFSAMILKRRNPNSTFLIFNNGKIVCCGTKSVADSFLVCKSVVRYLRKRITRQLKMENWHLQNLVATFLLDHRLNLDLLLTQLKRGDFPNIPFKTAEYEPELFSALQIKKPGRSILCFVTGKIILTGFTDPIELNEMYLTLKNCL